jgi:DNA-binding CsgD family transcriptional regulator
MSCAEAELALLGNDRPRARRAACAVLDDAHAAVPAQAAAAVVEAWIAVTNGERPAVAPPELALPLFAAARAEWDAVAALAGGAGRTAVADRLRDAADAWHGLFEWPRLRCLLGAADLLARDDRDEQARDLYHDVAVIASQLGMTAVATRAVRSARACGHSVPLQRRGRTGVLSDREREALGLAAEGATTREIAARMGVAETTVNSLLRSARQRLGARNRQHAAVRAIELGEITSGTRS